MTPVNTVCTIVVVMTVCCSCEKKLVTWRKDVVSHLTLDNPGTQGYYATYYRNFCAEGHFAYKFGTRISPYQGDGDDTGLNAIQLFCESLDGKPSSTVNGMPGGVNWVHWGDWEYNECPDGTFITGAQLKTQPPQGDGDDASVTNLALRCPHWVLLGQDVKGGEWMGKWGLPSYCPHGSYICGFNLKMSYPNIFASGDDTTVNDIKFYCCKP